MNGRQHEHHEDEDEDDDTDPLLTRVRIYRDQSSTANRIHKSDYRTQGTSKYSSQNHRSSSLVFKKESWYYILLPLLLLVLAYAVYYCLLALPVHRWPFLPSSVQVLLRSLRTWKYGDPIIQLCDLQEDDQQEVEKRYRQLAEKLFLTDRQYNRVPAGTYTTADISAIHSVDPRVTRWRWRVGECQLHIGCKPYPYYVDIDNTEHMTPPANHTAAKQIQSMLIQNLAMWSPFTSIPMYMDILINPLDETIHTYHPHDQASPPPPVPVFSPCSTDDVLDVPFVFASSWEWRFHRTEILIYDSLHQRSVTPFTLEMVDSCTAMATPSDLDRKRRQPIALWRGSTTGAVWTPDNYQQLRRYHLAKLSQSLNGTLIDARLTYCTQCEPKLQMEQILSQDLGKWFNVSFNSEFDLYHVQGVIDVDGNTWSSRLPQLLASGAVVFKQTSVYKEFWHDLLQPYVHFIPFHADLSDLESQVRSVLEQQQHTDVSINSVVFARHYLTDKAVHLYLKHLLTVYARLLRVPVYPVTRTVTSRTHFRGNR